MYNYSIKIFSILFFLVFNCGCSNVSNNNQPKEKVSVPKIDTIIYNYVEKSELLPCDSSIINVDGIIFYDRTDEQEYAVLYCNSLNKNNEINTSIESIKVPQFFLETFLKDYKILSSKALNYFAEFINKDCICYYTINYEARNDAYYLFILFNNKFSKNCYVYLKDRNETINYFRNLQKWLINSEYKKEFEELVKDIDYKINYLEKGGKW